MKRPLIVVTGCNGQIGYEITRIMTLLGDVMPVDMDELDLSRSEKVVSFMREHKPDIVINTAGYTSVDTAESNENAAMQVNAVVPGIIAEELKKTGGLIVHFSTDFAYDGTKTAPYHENDRVNPLSVYAKTKLAGDAAIIESGAKHLIFRTSWIYGARGRNFLLTMLSLCKNREELSVVNDQLGAPTWCRAVAEGVGLVLSRKEAFDPAYSGLYHMTCAGKVTWYEFAVKIAKFYEYKTKNRITVYPVSTGEYPMKAKRPKYSVLDNSKLNSAFGIVMPDWTVCFKQVMQDMGYEEPKSLSVFKRQ